MQIPLAGVGSRQDGPHRISSNAAPCFAFLRHTGSSVVTLHGWQLHESLFQGCKRGGHGIRNRSGTPFRNPSTVQTSAAGVAVSVRVVVGSGTGVNVSVGEAPNPTGPAGTPAEVITACASALLRYRAPCPAGVCIKAARLARELAPH